MPFSRVDPDIPCLIQIYKTILELDLQMAVSYFTISVVVVVLWAYLARFFGQRRHVNSAQYIQEQRAIANFGILGQHDIRDRLRARAIPNQRLVEAFGIVSSFTTEDPTIHSEFLRRAKIDINKMGPEHCVEFFNAAKTALDRTVAHLELPAQHTLPLARVVRAFVLITTLNKFFGTDPSTADVEAAIQATEAINRIWVQSKTGAVTRQDADQMQYALERLLPERFPCEAEEHPINILMPAYETMWRVVLLTYVASAFRGQDETAARQFRGVAETTPECLHPGHDYHQIALAYAKEGLRLYPPTRRIYRAVPTPQPGGSSDNEYTTAHADVGQCHRSEAVWGRDALQFRPARWLQAGTSTAQQRAYMPFGDGRYVCPAAGGFAYRAIVVLVAALARRLGTREDNVVVVTLGARDAALRRRTDAPLPYGRLQLEDWRLLRGKGASE
ncbi:hypothetical protein GGR52DRAFT_552390 [Hypoxylon sp. FL1284]|nr:hypothetical protein GGR52DRAFT_552390 [Hypoxylon sp. FL1284]